MAFKRVHPLVYISFTCSFVTHNKQETFVKHVSPHHLDIIGCTGICYGHEIDLINLKLCKENERKLQLLGFQRK